MNEYLGNNTGLDFDQKVQLHTESLFLFWTVILCKQTFEITWIAG